MQTKIDKHSRTNMFKDTSIFQGIIEFNSPIGEVRLEKRGSGIYGVYLKDEDASGFVQVGILKTKAIKNLAVVFQKAEKAGFFN